MNSLIIAGIVGYLIGSIPTAYLLVKWKSNVDIRSAGSGNVGTLNSFAVTRSKLVAAGVLVLDLLKGWAGVWIGNAVGRGDFIHVAMGAITVVVGHNFPIWLRFKGGRGLAPAAGAMLSLCWILVAAWGAAWAAGFSATRHVNIGNVIATVLLIVGVWFLPDAFLLSVIQMQAPPDAFRLFCALLLVPVLIRHVEPVREYFREQGSRHA